MVLETATMISHKADAKFTLAQQTIQAIVEPVITVAAITLIA